MRILQQECQILRFEVHQNDHVMFRFQLFFQWSMLIKEACSCSFNVCLVLLYHVAAQICFGTTSALGCGMACQTSLRRCGMLWQCMQKPVIFMLKYSVGTCSHLILQFLGVRFGRGAVFSPLQNSMLILRLSKSICDVRFKINNFVLENLLSILLNIPQYFLKISFSGIFSWFAWLVCFWCWCVCLLILFICFCKDYPVLQCKYN